MDEISILMSFRNDRDASRHRIDALEEEVAEKDRKIADLERELAGRGKASKKPGRKGDAAGRGGAVPQVAGLPEGDVWEVPFYDPKALWIALGWIVLLVGGALWMWLMRHDASMFIAAGIFTAPALVFVHRSGLVIDKRSKTLTHWHWLVVPWKKVLPLAGNHIAMETRLVTPKDSDSYWAGRVFLGNHQLFQKKKHEAERLGTRIAAFAGIPFKERAVSSKQIMREAEQPLRFMAIFMVIAAVIAGLLQILR